MLYGKIDAVSVFAAPVNQEHLETVLDTARQLGISKEKFKLSTIGCQVGRCGLYMEFTDEEIKENFLNSIAGTFDPVCAWAW